MDLSPNNIPEPVVDATQLPATPPPTLAPVWHTALFIAGILALSITGSSRFAAMQHTPHRLATYAATAGMEFLMLLWVLFGLRLRKVSLRTLIGSTPLNFRSIARDFGIALVFWIASLSALGTLGAAWSRAEAAITHQPVAQRSTGSFLPGPTDKKTASKLARIAPQNAQQIAGWALLCIFVGFVEELVFRGYFQLQFTAWTHGNVVAGVIFSAVLFGAAHGYQGLRSMVLLSAFGVFFSLLALYRRGLRSCMFAHAWQDFFAGLALALLHSRHVI